MSPLPLYQVYVGKYPYWEPVQGEWAVAAVYWAAMRDFGQDAITIKEIKHELNRTELKEK